MWDITNFVTLAEANDVREVVLHDAEVIAMVRDVGRQEECVATTDDALLAQIGRAPVDFQRQLIGLHDTRWFGESLSDLREKSEIAVSVGAIVGEAGIGELRRAKSCGKLHERARRRIVPDQLRGCHARRGQHD